MSDASQAPEGRAEAPSPAASSAWTPQITALVCRWCTYAGADMAGTSRLVYPPTVRLVRLPCTGRMSPLFILKAFEQGADGVLVSGCHPGDCHYVQGNLHARRRFAVFRALMEFVGLDPRRLHFSWVSAAEGIKWVQVVERVHRDVLAAGPASPSRGPAGDEAVTLPPPGDEPRPPAAVDETAVLETGMRELAAKLLTDHEVSLLLGYRRGSLPGPATAAFVTRAGDADELVWDAQCLPNLPVYLPRLHGREGKTGVVVKKCDVSSVVGLLQEGQVRREDLTLIGVPCSGVRDGDRLAEKCFRCDGSVPEVCDVAVTAEGGTRSNEGAERASEDVEDPRDRALAFLEALPPDERWRFWREEFGRCIRCYACRAVCPLCYCETCIADKHRPQWISTAIEEDGNTAWNLVRAFHLAGRCTECGECTRVCPAQIRLDLINRKLALEVERLFGYRSGEDAAAAPPLTVFRDDDPQEFIL